MRGRGRGRKHREAPSGRSFNGRSLNDGSCTPDRENEHPCSANHGARGTEWHLRDDEEKTDCMECRNQHPCQVYRSRLSAACGQSERRSRAWSARIRTASCAPAHSERTTGRVHPHDRLAAHLAGGTNMKLPLPRSDPTLPKSSNVPIFNLSTFPPSTYRNRTTLTPMLKPDASSRLVRSRRRES